MNVRRASLADASTVRALRLHALADAPDAFGSTLEAEAAWGHAEWERWVERGATFLAEDQGGAFGLAAGVPDRDDPAHAFLISMWIRPESRRRGAADALVRAVLGWAESEGYRNVRLHVGSHNDPARRLYERHGFRATGTEIPGVRAGIIEIEMARPAHASDGGPAGR